MSNEILRIDPNACDESGRRVYIPVELMREWGIRYLDKMKELLLSGPAEFRVTMDAEKNYVVQTEERPE